MNKLEELNALLKSGAIDENEYELIKAKLGLEEELSNDGDTSKSEKKDESKQEEDVKDYNNKSEYQSDVITKEDSIEDVQVESVKKEEKIKVNQKETDSGDSKNRNKNSFPIVFLIVVGISIIGFLNQDMLLGYFGDSPSTDIPAHKIDNYQIESDIIREYVNAIDNRDVIKAISYWHDHPERYWDLHYPSLLDISEKIKDSWRISSHSKNSIFDIIKVDKNTYHLSTNFTYTSRKTGVTETVNAKVAYIFNNNHMIISSYGIKIDNSVSENDEIIKNIRDDFYYLKNNWANLKKFNLSDNITIFSTLEYPSLNNHFCAKILNAGINYEFYVNQEKLYFVYSYFEGVENRYYFNSDGKIIKWLDSNKSEVQNGVSQEKNRLNLIFEEIYFNTEKNEKIKESNIFGVINDPTGYTNVRADKSSSSSVIYEIYDENQQFEIIDDSDEWWKIKFDINEYPYEIIGFIHNSRVELIDNDEDFLVAKNGFINANNLNFRSTPEINNQNIISYLQYGDNVNILSSVNKTLTDVKHCIIENDIVVNIDGVKTVILAGKMLDIWLMKDSYIVCGYELKNGEYKKFSVDYSDVDVVRQEKWYKIEFDNNIGYIYQKFVTFY